MGKAHVIWSNMDIEETMPELSEIRADLDIQLSESIIIVAEIGRWNGKFHGYSMIDSGNIKDCFYTKCDMVEWYVDSKGDLRCTAIHHDGTNHYLYREIKPQATERQIESLKDKIYSGTVTRENITKTTRGLGDDIAKVYGFSIGKTKEQKER